jgi:hypothetical protein
VWSVITAPHSQREEAAQLKQQVLTAWRHLLDTCDSFAQVSVTALCMRVALAGAQVLLTASWPPCSSCPVVSCFRCGLQQIDSMVSASFFLARSTSPARSAQRTGGLQIAAVYIGPMPASTNGLRNRSVLTVSRSFLPIQCMCFYTFRYQGVSVAAAQGHAWHWCSHLNCFCNILPTDCISCRRSPCVDMAFLAICANLACSCVLGCGVCI